MGIKRAYDALTNPKPSERQFLIWFMASRLAAKRGVKSPIIKIEAIYHMFAILLRWGFINGENMPNLSRDAVGNLCEDVKDAWHIIATENL